MERRRVLITWCDAGTTASVTDETYEDDHLVHRHVVPDAALDNPLVARAIAQWQEGTLRLFDR